LNNILFHIQYEIDDQDTLDSAWVEGMDMIEAVHLLMDVKGIKIAQIHEVTAVSNELIKKSNRITGKGNA
jgi:hypothetical protein